MMIRAAIFAITRYFIAAAIIAAMPLLCCRAIIAIVIDADA